MIKIKRCVNGAMVKWEGQGDVVYKFDDLELEGLIEMLYDIKHELASAGSYSIQDIEIKLVHGRKYECKDKKCKICKNYSTI